MNSLLRLYPRAWRERYGDELLALLEEHPATLVDLFDLIRGALDARLHPQVRGAATPDKEPTMDQRLLGVLALVGGIAWTVGVATALVLPPDPYGSPDMRIAAVGAAIGTSLMGIALGELGTRPGSAGAYTARVIGVASVLLGLTMLLPWPWFTIGMLGFPILVILAGTRAYQNGRLPGWLTGLLIATSVAAVVGAFGMGSSFTLYALPGPTGVVLGLLVLLRPSNEVSEPGPA